MTPEDRPENGPAQRRFFYGYVIVFACFVIMVLTFGINYSFGIFFKPLLTEFGWTRAATSAAYSLSLLVSGLLGIFAGRLGDSFGPKIIGMMTGVFLCAGLLLLSQIQNLWHFYLFYGVIVAAGIGGCWPGLIPTVAKWFTMRRGLMTGIVASGTGFGIITIPPLAERFISLFSWRTAYIIIAILTLVCIGFVSLFLKTDPRQIGQSPYGEKETDFKIKIGKHSGFSYLEAVKTKPFWLLGFIYFDYGYCLHTTMVHIAPHVQDLGFSSAEAASILAVIGLFNTFSRVAMGSTSDRFGAKPSLLFEFIVLVISLLCIQVTRGLGMFYLFAIIFGTGSGGIISLQALVAAEIFGLRSLGIIVGTLAFFYTIGGATGALVSGLIFDLMGSYYPAFWVTAAIAFVSLFLIKPLKMPLSSIRSVRSKPLPSSD